jgi:hypothetical protein
MECQKKRKKEEIAMRNFFLLLFLTHMKESRLWPGVSDDRACAHSTFQPQKKILQNNFTSFILFFYLFIFFQILHLNNSFAFFINVPTQNIFFFLRIKFDRKKSGHKSNSIERRRTVLCVCVCVYQQTK